jgi:hypothetical protein
MRLKLGDHRVLAVSDLQEPFAHPDAFNFIKAVKEHCETDTTVFAGDEVDFHGVSPRFFHDPDGLSPGHELERAVEALGKWYDLFAGEGLIRVCTSNHTGRIFKKAFAAGIPKNFLRKVNEFLEAPPEWEWRDYWEVDGVRYEHGDAAGGMFAARNLALSNRQSTVIGHHHSNGGVNYMANDSELIFGLNTGCLIDRSAYVFDYGKQAKFKPTLGCGVVLYGVPYFVPMILDKKERWTGDLIV